MSQVYGPQTTTKVIDLNSISREKIVIRPKKVESEKKPPLSSRASIFKSSTSSGKPLQTKPPPTPAQCPASSNVQPSLNTVIDYDQKMAQESTPALKLSRKSGTIEASKVKKKQRQPSKSPPHSIRSVFVPPSQINNVTTTPMRGPVEVLSQVRKSNRPSPYAEEYIKCPCTTKGQFPCQRCQLMLLADRFCDLVDVQCQKWDIPLRP